MRICMNQPGELWDLQTPGGELLNFDLKKMDFFTNWFKHSIWVFPKIVVPPNSSILIGFSFINHPFWGTPIFGNTHFFISCITLNVFFLSSCCWTLWMVNLVEEMCNIGWLRTGNPLVDSVAEHQAASEQAYDMYLSTPRYLAFIGLFFCWHQKTPAKIFPATCFAENGYFSKRLNFTRLFFCRVYNLKR